MAEKLLRSLLWRRNDITSLEYCTLTERDGEFVLAGTVVTDVDGQPVRCGYVVVCSSAWLTRRVRVAEHGSNVDRSSSLRMALVTGGATAKNWRLTAAFSMPTFRSHRQPIRSRSGVVGWPAGRALKSRPSGSVCRSFPSSH
jgi:hypothetical protein